MKKRYIIYFLIFVLLFGGPIWIGLSGKINFKVHWRQADRASAHIAPLASKYKPAIVQIYAARAYNWRGMFAVHTWIAVKLKDAKSYTVYQVVGWRSFAGLPVIYARHDIPDRIWFGHRPWLIKDIRGERAARLIPKIAAVVAKYPYIKTYHFWPGPNSNTFTAYIGRRLPQLGLVMPAIAVGKDFLTGGKFIAKMPSNSGYQFSLLGLCGILVAKQEGVELNVLGLVLGFNPWRPAIIIPGVGRIKL